MTEAIKQLSSPKAHPDLLEAPGTSARLAPGAPAAAPGRAAAAASPPTTAHRQRPATSAGGGRCDFLWAYDFVFDSCANDQQLKCLTIVDKFTRECLAIEVAGSIRSKRVIEVLARPISQHGTPLFLHLDNGPEFVSLAILKWLAHAGIGTAPIDPDKPWQNANDKSFNGKVRDECLSVEWFRSRAEAKIVIETWLLHFNAIRPRSSLNYLTPARVQLAASPRPQPEPPSRNDWPEYSGEGHAACRV